MRKKGFFVALAVLYMWQLSACAQIPSDVPSWQEQYDLGVRYLSEGNYEEAIIAFTAAIEIDPKQARAYIGRGDAYVSSGETEENLMAAQTDYEKAIDLDASIPEAYLGLSNVYICQGNMEKASEILRNGLVATGENAFIAGRLSELGASNGDNGNGKIVSIYGDESEVAHLLREGDAGKSLSIDELSFYGANYHGLSIDTAEGLLHQNGFQTQRIHDGFNNMLLDGSMRMEGEILYGPRISVRQDNDQSYINSWSYADAWRDEDKESLPIGVRDICIGDSLETVLSKLGFTTAQEIAQLATEYYSQEFICREDLKTGIEDWRYSAWIESAGEHQKYMRIEFDEPLIQGGNFLENGHLVVDSISFFICLGVDEIYDEIYIPFEFEKGRLTSAMIIL